MRKIPILAAAAFVILFVARAASAQGQHCFGFGQQPPCRTTVGPVPKAWKSVTFGPATFVKPKKASLAVQGWPTARGAHGAHSFAPMAALDLDPHWFIRR